MGTQGPARPPSLAALGRSSSLSSNGSASSLGSNASALAARFQQQDAEQVDALWRRVRREVLDPLEAALARFDPQASEVVRAKYYDVYSSVYHVVNDPGRDDLDRHPLILQKHMETLTDYLQRVTLPQLAEARDPHLLLRAVGEQWERFDLLNSWLHKLLIFVERSYVGRQPSHLRLGLRERGVRRFAELVFSNSGHGRLAPLVAAIDAVVARRRALGPENVELEDREACRTCVALLVETGVTGELREQLLATAREFFAGCAAEWIREGGVAPYMTRVEAMLLQEEALIREFELGSATGERTLVVGVQELIQAHGEALLTRDIGGCAWLLQQRKHDDLGLMYRMFKREGMVPPPVDDEGGEAAAVPAEPPALPSLASTTFLTSTTDPTTSAASTNNNEYHPLLDKMGALLEAHIVALGEELQVDRVARLGGDKKLEAYDPTYVDRLLKLHAESVELTTTTLGAHSVFKTRLHAAFVAILNNHHPPKGLKPSPPEEKPRLITTYCDRLLRVGGTAEEQRVNEVLALVVYLKDKDYFEGCYRTELMRRLLANKYGEGAEKSALARLRLEHGVHFAQHAQRMLNETAASKELVQRFLHTPEAEALRAAHRPLVDFGVTVMAQGGWPLPASYAQFACRPPPALAGYMGAFTAFYHSLDVGRGKRLEWVLREGLLVIQASYGDGGRYELSSSPPMLLPLLAFSMDDSTELPLPALLDRTGLTPANLDIVLTELQRAGLLTVVKHPGQGGSSSTGAAPLVPKDESSEAPAVGSNTTATTSATASTTSAASSNKSSGAGAASQAVVLLNTNFSSRHKRITLLPKKMEEDREKAVSEDVMKERTLKCQAIVVRVMKLKKTLAHRDLVVEAIRQCKHFNFTPEVSFVKRVVEGLIETEYLRRTPERRDWVDYVA